MSDLRGLFIVLEGGDGAGKTTQQRLLAEELSRQGRTVVCTREPGGTELGRALREHILYGEDIDARTEALLYAADRAEHVATVIEPALARGEVVLCDRYLDSSLAYQVDGRGLAEADIRAINAVATGGLEPDLVLVLDIDPAAGASRRTCEADRLESAGQDFHARVRHRYLELAAAGGQRYHVIDAAATVADVHAAVLAALGSATKAPS